MGDVLLLKSARLMISLAPAQKVGQWLRSLNGRPYAGRFRRTSGKGHRHEVTVILRADVVPVCNSRSGSSGRFLSMAFGVQPFRSGLIKAATLSMGRCQ